MAIITVLNDFMPFLLTNREELSTKIASTEYEKRCHTAFGTVKRLLHFHFSVMAYIPQLKTQGQTTHLTKIHPIHHKNVAAFTER